jgi:hypothetical protein
VVRCIVAVIGGHWVGGTANTVKVGKCRLCLNDPVELQRSHFFPAAAYKIIREETIREGFQNPNPVRMTDVSAVQTSEQYTSRLLCHQCEQRFQANGERWVLGNCWRGDTFRLSGLIAGEKASLACPEASVYDASGIPGINIFAITFFAASMFWRAAVHNWSGRSIEPAIDFGPYEKQLRQYLNGVAEFPKDCMLGVVLPPPNSNLVKHKMHPYPTLRSGFCIYTLPFLGIGFSLFVGRQIPRDWRGADFVRGAGNPIIVDARFDKMFGKDLLFMFWDKSRALTMLKQIE